MTASRNPVRVQSEDVTVQIIINRFATEQEIQLEKYTVSLLCPLLRTRIIVPVRSTDCTHLQCYDLSNYVKLNDNCIGTSRWRCPVCTRHAPYEKMVIDQFFVNVLDIVPKHVEEVELLSSGGWRAVRNKRILHSILMNTIDIDDDVDEEDTVVAVRNMQNKSTVSDSSQMRVRKVEVITLDDSDHTVPKVRTSGVQNTASTIGTTVPQSICNRATVPHNVVRTNLSTVPQDRNSTRSLLDSSNTLLSFRNLTLKDVCCPPNNSDC